MAPSHLRAVVASIPAASFVPSIRPTVDNGENNESNIATTLKETQ
jgi:hypothetical protein